MTSLVYRNILLYRTAMNVLYGGRYRRRFEDVVRVLRPGTLSVCDLCFGDTFIAKWCEARGIRWTGIDLNPAFCARARRLGFNAIEGDLLSIELPRADAYLMAGSLYHFHDRLTPLFEQIWRHTDRFVLSEPVRNISSGQGLVARLARRSANPGDAHAPFRYNETSLMDALRAEQEGRGFSLRVVSVGRDLLAEMHQQPA